ncbi:unnamed protein product, partial [Polarella glacialis]
MLLACALPAFPLGAAPGVDPRIYNPAPTPPRRKTRAVTTEGMLRTRSRERDGNVILEAASRSGTAANCLNNRFQSFSLEAPHRSMDDGSPSRGSRSTDTVGPATIPVVGTQTRDADMGAEVPVPPPPVTDEHRRADRPFTRAPSGRIRCPVPGCPASDPAQAPGWQSLATMHSHPNSHRAGDNQGAAPPSWLVANRLTQRTECDEFMVGEQGATHPRCRPNARARAATAGEAGRALQRAAPNSHNNRPTLDEIMSSKRPTLKHVPKGCRHVWSAVLAQALAAAHLAAVALGGRTAPADTSRCVDAWVELFMLPKCTLNPTARSGRRHRKLTSQHTKARLERWLAGERAELWQDGAPKNTGKPKAKTSKEVRRRRALDLVEEDRLGPACAALSSQGSAPDTPATLAALQAKHPTGQAPSPEAAPPRDAATPALTPEEVLKAVQAFRNGSAAGPSGLRPQHLLDGVRSPDQRVALEALTDVLNTLVWGRVPICLAPAIAGAALHAIAKGEGDVRPIAVGETLRRLASRCLCASTKEDATQYLRPLQAGVACPLGTEAAFRAVDQYARRHANSSTKVALKIDFANAFNTAGRETFLRACNLHAPSAARWSWRCYSQPTTLYYGDTVLQSSAGVQQGDNLGPLLFSLALQPVLLRLKAHYGASNKNLDLLVAYLDDVVLAGDADIVAEALGVLQEACSTIGLLLDLSKCEVIPTAGLASAADLSIFPASSKRTAQHCLDYTRSKRVDTIKESLTELSDLGEGHCAYKILATCMGSCKVMYSMRTARPDWAHDAFAEFDCLVRTAFENIIGAPLSNTALQQSVLSSSKGGLGLRSAATLAPAAYVASVCSTWDLCRDIDPNYIWEGEFAGSGIAMATQILNSQLPVEEQLDIATAPPSEPHEQRNMSDALEQAAALRLRAAGTDSNGARLRAAAAPHAGAWLNAPACRNAGLRLTSAEFAAAAMFRAGASFMTSDTWCPKRDRVLEHTAAHAVACAGGGHRVVRHNSIRDECYWRCLAVGVEAEREESGLLPSDPLRRPADVFLAAWPGGIQLALDFAVTCPLQADMRADAAARPLA